MSLFNVSYHSRPRMPLFFQVETFLSSRECSTSVKTTTSSRWEPAWINFAIPEFFFRAVWYVLWPPIGGSGPWNGSLGDRSYCRTTDKGLFHTGDKQQTRRQAWGRNFIMDMCVDPPAQIEVYLWTNVDLRQSPADIASPICSPLGCSPKRWCGSCGRLVLSKG